jgi:hypothetical protein
MTSDAAKIQLLAIGLQESRLKYRRQIGGPAVGLWQFEKGGGVKGVLTHGESDLWARVVCAKRDVFANPDAVYKAIPNDDILAAAFARLLLWTDPDPLPAIGNAEAAWNYYIANWRPGKPHRETWDDFYKQAVSAVQGE